MQTIWLLFHVHHGLIQEPEVFLNEQSAIERKFSLVANLNRDYDEIEVFGKEVDFTALKPSV